MAGEETVLGVPLTPSSDAQETRVENLPTTVEVMVSQAEARVEDPFEDIDIEEDNTTIHPSKSSHVNYGKSRIKGGHIEVLNCFGYIDNVNWVRLGGDDLVPKPKEDEVCRVPKLPESRA
jgi:hypothetical protein